MGVMVSALGCQQGVRARVRAAGKALEEDDRYQPHTRTHTFSLLYNDYYYFLIYLL